MVSRSACDLQSVKPASLMGTGGDGCVFRGHPCTSSVATYLICFPGFNLLTTLFTNFFDYFGSAQGPRTCCGPAFCQFAVKTADTVLPILSCGLVPGFDRACRTLGPALCQGLDAEGVCPMMLRNVVHYVLVKS